MEKKTIMLKRHKATHVVQEALDAIIRDLELYGRTTTENGSASRFLSYRMKYPKEREQIYFHWMPQHKKSLIALKTGIKLVRISKNKVRLVYEGELEK